MSAPRMLTVLGVGPLELAVLTALWDTERPLTVREVLDQLSYPGWPTYPIVAEVLSRLYFKGRVRRTRDHGRWYYSATQNRDEYLAGCIRAFLAEAPDPAAVLMLAAQPADHAFAPHGPDQSALGRHETAPSGVQRCGRDAGQGS